MIPGKGLTAQRMMFVLGYGSWFQLSNGRTDRRSIRKVHTLQLLGGVSSGYLPGTVLYREVPIHVPYW